ncbi:MAG: GGDEF domain-containing protein, partial [Lachnospiraceae bacterium]|nr:GGDEF domain-containing protein [Lachnospiraceae bacterium]
SGTEKLSALCESSRGVLLIMDIDDLGLVNERFGHDTGDRILVAFASAVRHNTRSGDVVCRMGGDEFVAFLADMTHEQDVASLENRLNEELKKETALIMGDDHGLDPGISIGAAFVPDGSADYSVLLKNARSALDTLVAGKKHGYMIYDPE